MTTKRSLAAALAAVCMAASGLIASAPAAATTVPLTAEIETRDHLIADQEALLNAYRCMFAVDVTAVPGGCANGAPAQPAGEPGPPPPNPTKADKDARDNLIAAQEHLLNTYRCNHNIDTQLVPSGCSKTTTEPAGDDVPTFDPVEDTDQELDNDEPTVDPVDTEPEEEDGQPAFANFRNVIHHENGECPAGTELTLWNVCEDPSKYIPCSAEDAISDFLGLCYDPAIWGDCPYGMSIDPWGFCGGYSRDYVPCSEASIIDEGLCYHAVFYGDCPSGYVLEPWGFCEHPARNEYSAQICRQEGPLIVDIWARCHHPDSVDWDYPTTSP